MKNPFHQIVSLLLVPFLSTDPVFASVFFSDRIEKPPIPDFEEQALQPRAAGSLSPGRGLDPDRPQTFARVYKTLSQLQPAVPRFLGVAGLGLSQLGAATHHMEMINSLGVGMMTAGTLGAAFIWRGKKVSPELEAVVSGFEEAIEHSFEPEIREHFVDLLRPIRNVASHQMLRILGNASFKWERTQYFMQTANHPNPGKADLFSQRIGSAQERLHLKEKPLADAYARYLSYASTHKRNHYGESQIAVWIAGMLSVEEDLSMGQNFLRPFIQEAEADPKNVPLSNKPYIPPDTPADSYNLYENLAPLIQEYFPGSHTLPSVLPRLRDHMFNRMYAIRGDALLNLIIARLLVKYKRTHAYPSVGNIHYQRLIQDRTLMTALDPYVVVTPEWSALTYESLVWGVYLANGHQGMMWAEKFVFDSLHETFKRVERKLLGHEHTELAPHPKAPLNPLSEAFKKALENSSRKLQSAA